MNDFEQFGNYERKEVLRLTRRLYELSVEVWKLEGSIVLIGYME